MNLTMYVARRLLLIIPMVLGITIILFGITRLIPVDPIAIILPEKAQKDPAAVEEARKQWGLDKGPVEQYLSYLLNLTKGDMGTSFMTKNPVSQDIFTYLPATIELGVFAFIFAVIIGLPLGIASALRAGKFVDHGSRIFALFGASMPPFWSGLLVLFLFNYKLGIMPGPGRIDARMVSPNAVTRFYLIDSLLASDGQAFWSSLHHLIMPAIILGWFVMALITRITRSSLLDALDMDYIRTARAKGLKEKMVITRHALRNAMIPLVTVLGMAFADLMTGAIMTETIFAWPGIGHYAVMASSNLDYPALTGVTLIIAILYIFMNLLVDILYGFIDPRIREA